MCWDVRRLGSCVFCCLSSRNRISLELCHLLLAGRKNHHHDGSQFFMKVSCEFHLKFLSAYCSILESRFEAILVELTLLLDFLMVVWFVPLVVSVEDWFFQVNDVSVLFSCCIFELGFQYRKRGSWPQRVCAVTCFKASVTQSFGLA